jgi:hypothetical protein
MTKKIIFKPWQKFFALVVDKVLRPDASVWVKGFTQKTRKLGQIPNIWLSLSIAHLLFVSNNI